MGCYLFCLGYKGYFVLQELARLNRLGLICGVVSCEDTTQESYFENIKEICLKNNVKFFHKKMIDMLDKKKIAIAIAWRWIIKDFSQVIVMHDSLLPKYRGFNPLVTSLINGDEYIGVSVLYGINEYDKGDIIAQRSLKIFYPITIWEAILKISYLYAELCVEVLEKISKGQKILGVPQEQKEATYSLWRDDKDYFIQWGWSSDRIVRFVDAVGFPYDGAKILFEGNVLRVLKAEIFGDVRVVNRDYGKVIFMDNGCCVVVCKSGLVKLCEVVDMQGRQWSAPRFRIRFE